MLFLYTKKSFYVIIFCWKNIVLTNLWLSEKPSLVTITQWLRLLNLHSFYLKIMHSVWENAMYALYISELPHVPMEQTNPVYRLNRTKIRSSINNDALFKIDKLSNSLPCRHTHGIQACKKPRIKPDTKWQSFVRYYSEITQQAFLEIKLHRGKKNIYRTDTYFPVLKLRA